MPVIEGDGSAQTGRKNRLGRFCLGLLCLACLGACDSALLSQGGGSQPVALLYGITYYLPSLPAGVGNNLTAPDNDVDGLQTTLQSHGWKTISQKDSAATTTQLAQDVANLAATIQPGQRVLFYWSGHGLQYPSGSTAADNQYLGLYGVIRSGQTGFDFSAMLNASQLAAVFKPLSDKGANLIFILDSCYSGGFVDTGTYANALPDNYSSISYLGDPTHDNAVFSDALAAYFGGGGSSDSGLDSPQVWVLSAAGKDEVSWESSSVMHGIFSFFFIDCGTPYNGGLPADYNGDGQVGLKEAYRYCKDQIQNHWNSKYALATASDYQFLPHLSGNPLDIKIF